MRPVVALLVVLPLTLAPLVASQGLNTCGTCTTACTVDPPSVTSMSTEAQPLTNATCPIPGGAPPSIASRGSWYAFTGDGSSITIDTCSEDTSFPTLLYVFTSCSPDTRAPSGCVASSASTCGKDKATMTFATELGKKYYAFLGGRITGSSSSVGATGWYKMGVSKEVERHTNESPSQATEMAKLPYAVQGDTGVAREGFRGSCRDNATRRGHWYRVTGAGRMVVARTCSDATGFDTALEVYTAVSPDPVCATWGDNECMETRSVASWLAKQGVTYYLFVTGSTAAQSGKYSLTVEETDPAPNSKCSEAIGVGAPPKAFKVNTANAPESVALCHKVDQSGPDPKLRGVWFRLEGTNSLMTVSTCEDDSNAETAIDVYTSCSSDGVASQCLHWNDNFCGTNAAVTFMAKAPLYYILVSSKNPKGAQVTVSFFHAANETNGKCVSATKVDYLPFDLSGNTKDMPTSKVSCGDDPKTKEAKKGAWLSYTRPSALKQAYITAKTCNAENKLATDIEIIDTCHTGTCVSFGRYLPNSSCASVLWRAKPGSTYGIFISGTHTVPEANRTGYYHVDIYENVRPDNDNCPAAHVVPSTPYVVIQDTFLAESSWGGCDGFATTGLWFTVVGTGSKMTASSCDPVTDFEMDIDVYAGCPADNVKEKCIAHSSADTSKPCGTKGIVSWDSARGQKYWVFVHGILHSKGIFALSLSDSSVPSNPQCWLAEQIPEKAKAWEVFGRTTKANYSKGDCEPNFAERKSLWYSFKAKSGVKYTLDTCGEQTQFDTDIEVYETCSKAAGATKCLAHTHDAVCSPRTSVTVKGKGKLVYVRVTGSGKSEGTFHLKFKKVPGGTSFGSFLLTTLCIYWSGGVLAAIVGASFALYKKHKRSSEYHTLLNDPAKL